MVIPQEKIIRPKELSEMIGVSRTSLWRFERDGNFPKHINLGVRSIGWRLSEIYIWMEQHQAA